MDLQQMITFFMELLLLSIVLATISKFTNDGILTAWGITNAWIKRLLVFLVNVLLTYFSCRVLNDFDWIVCGIVLLFVAAGADSLHKIVNEISDLNSINNVESIPEATQFDDTEE